MAATDAGPRVIYETTEFQEHLTKLVNYCSMEVNSDTADFILAEYLVACLKAYNYALERRRALSDG